MLPSFRSMRVLVLVALIPIVAAPLAEARRAAKGRDSKAGEGGAARVERWLALGPATHRLPAFHAEDRGGYEAKALLDESLGVPGERPEAGARLEWVDGGTLRWKEARAAEDGLVALSAPDGSAPAIAWAAVYISVDGWRKLELELDGGHPRELRVDGASVARSDDGEGEAKGEVELTRGKHLVVVRTVRDPSIEADWSFGLSIAAVRDEDAGEEAPAKAPEVALSLEPARTVELRDVLDPPTVGSLAVSPDGSQVAVTVSRTVPGGFESESWIELRSTADGSLRESWRGALGASQVAWSPDGRYLSYVAKAAGDEDGKASTLFLLDRENGGARPLLEGVEALRGYRWSPDGTRIAYSVEVEAAKDERGVKRVESVMDRWKTYRDKRYLYVARVPGGARRRITAGALTTEVADFSPDGRRLLFSRTVEDLTRRPYSRSELWEVDLETFEARELRKFRWLDDARFAPDGRRILIAAPARAFDGAGIDLPGDVVPNDYDGQLFVWDPQSGEVDPIARDFDPAVRAARWSGHDGRIYLVATERDRSALFRYDPGARSFERVDTGVDVFDTAFDLARDAAIAVGTGSSAWEPQSLVAVDLERRESRALAHPADEWFEVVRPGTVRDWSFAASSGRTIDGRVYLPPGFDERRTYPCIVYYYGGTTPVTRTFGGRYPKEWWAAQGYVVYVLQPSGAIGYGQSFSAAHVNDWGKTTVDEIVEGTRAFLAAHEFVDPARVGCIGASYGGFMTMLISTATDVFAAAVAHAGISSLASYWGEGYWGYSYSSVATAESFPWNRRDIFVDQSPLFRADRARVPILLTHGAADTNVPVGESDQFFVALKLLGKEVEYLQIEGQDHWILDREKREVWSNSIVAWFDRWLKGDSAWWDALYD